MKKRILALLLAGLLTASMGSCISREKGREGDTGGLEGVQPPTQTEYLPPVTAFEEIDDTVYTTRVNVNLRPNISSAEGIVSISGATKLHRIKKSSTWSVVEYNGKEYYVETAALTAEDIFGEGFVVCNPAENKFANNINSVDIYRYAATKKAAPISDVLGRYAFNEAVVVIAKGANWSKVKKAGADGVEIIGFVENQYLSNTVSENPLTKDYTPFFDACEPKQVAVLEGLNNLNVVPVRNVKVHTTLEVTKEKPVSLTLIGIGKGEYADWCKVSYADPVKEGDPQTYTTCYIHKTCLKGFAGSVTLDEFLATYTGFTKCTKQTLYVLASTQGMNARKTPVFEGTENIGAWLAPKDAVEVVASGMADGLLRYVIEYEDGNFYFVTAKYLTPNASGEAMAETLADLLVLHPNFTATIPTKDLYATGKVNCYKSPSVSETVPHALAVGSKVTQVAKSKDGIWCIIQLADGALYFAGAGLFSEQAPVG